MICNAHAQLDDSFDEEFEVANYNLAQVAELEAARRLKALTQNQYENSNANTGFDAMQIDSGAFEYHANVPAAAPSNNAHMVTFGGNNANCRKLKRSCEYESANANNNAEFERSNKRVKAAF